MKTIRNFILFGVLLAGILYAGMLLRQKTTPVAAGSAEEPSTCEPEHQTTPPESFEITETKEKETREETPVMEPVQPSVSGTFSFLACGDNLIHERIIRWGNLLAGGSGEKRDYANSGFSFLPIYENVSEFIRTADLAVISQASLVGANDSPEALSGYPLFNTPSQMGRDLKEMGFDLVDLAGNHMMDLGDGGLSASLDLWEKIGMPTVGAYRSEKEFNDVSSKIHLINGVRCAILSYTGTTNGLYPKTDDVYIPYYLTQKREKFTEIEKKMLTEQISSCRRAADCVIVFVNWGTQSGFSVDETQEETAKILASAGADVVIGTGAKVIQKIEWIRGEDSDRQTLCAYSPGNFLCTMEKKENLLGGMLNFEVEKTGEGRCLIKNVTFLPTVIHYEKDGENIGVYLLSSYTEALFSRHVCASDPANEYAWFRRALDRYIPKEFLPAALRS